MLNDQKGGVKLTRVTCTLALGDKTATSRSPINVNIFVAVDIFNGKKLEGIVPSSHNCDVPHVNRTDYQLIDISEDGFVSLLTENGNTKDELRLPTDDNLLTQIKNGFGDGKDLVVSVMSAMGEEQICDLKDIGPK
ncbi:eukaryotic translation initiation factor 5A [Quercus suber]|uniref:eukaryotic translation initiation factor 5A n=1 Tax=Quercus suber TaxID=58331 RepID=UPI0032DFACAA